MDHARSKSAEQFFEEPFDLVVTVCDSAAADCPTWPKGPPPRALVRGGPRATSAGATRSAQEAFRATRDEKRRRIDSLMEALRRSQPKRTDVDLLKEGAGVLADFMAVHGLKPQEIRDEKIEGRATATTRFAKRNRALELRVRSGVTIAVYSAGGRQIPHPDYMERLGVAALMRYPGLSKDPLDTFRRLRADLIRFAHNLTGTVSSSSPVSRQNPTRRRPDPPSPPKGGSPGPRRSVAEKRPDRARARSRDRPHTHPRNETGPVKQLHPVRACRHLDFERLAGAGAERCRLTVDSCRPAREERVGDNQTGPFLGGDSEPPRHGPPLFDLHASGSVRAYQGLCAPIDEDPAVGSGVDLLEVQAQARSEGLGAEREPGMQQQVLDVPEVEPLAAGSDIPGLEHVRDRRRPDEVADLAPALPASLSVPARRSRGRLPARTSSPTPAEEKCAAAGFGTRRDRSGGARAAASNARCLPAARGRELPARAAAARRRRGGRRPARSRRPLSPTPGAHTPRAAHPPPPRRARPAPAEAAGARVQ